MDQVVKGVVYFSFGAYLVVLATAKLPPLGDGFRIGQEAIYELNQRRSYYPGNVLPRLLENRVAQMGRQWGQRLFEAWDINRYFFASHPRERATGTNLVILPYWTLGLLGWGLISRHPWHRLAGWLFVVATLGGVLFGPRHEPAALLMVWPIVVEIGGGVWALIYGRSMS